MSAHNAVIWVTPVRGGQIEQERVEIALIGDANLAQPNGVTRSGPTLYVDSRLSGPFKVNAKERLGGDRSDSELYQQAMAMRPVLLRRGGGGGGGREWLVQEQVAATQPATRPVVLPQQTTTVKVNHFEMTKPPDGKVGAVPSGNVRVFQESVGGDTILLQADRAV